MPGLSRKDFPLRTPNQRAGEWRTLLADEGERVWTLPNGRTVTISNVSGSANSLSFDFELRRANGTLVHKDSHVIINPPLYHPDGGTDAEGEPTYTKNIRAILRETVVRNLPL